MLTFVTLVNDPAQLERCQESLLRGTSEAPPWITVRPDLHGWNAARGLNHAMAMVKTAWVVCTHQDVLFPLGWARRVEELLADLPADCAVAGLVGNLAGGQLRGHIVDPNGHCYWGPLPARVLVLDEAVMILRSSSGLRFDEETPGFHLYGADLCLQAEGRGFSSIAIDAPVHHLSTGTLDEKYALARSWMLTKWGARFGYVLPTPASLLEDPQRCNPLRWALIRWRRRRDVRNRNRHRRKLEREGWTF